MKRSEAESRKEDEGEGDYIRHKAGIIITLNKKEALK